jgi:hypothetical protein
MNTTNNNNNNFTANPIESHRFGNDINAFYEAYGLWKGAKKRDTSPQSDAAAVCITGIVKKQSNTNIVHNMKEPASSLLEVCLLESDDNIIEVTDANEAKFIEYLEAKMQWELPDDGTTFWGFTCLQYQIEKYESETTIEWRNEMFCKYKCNLEKEDDIRIEEVAIEEVATNVNESLSLWERYGLSVEDWVIYQEYLKNIALLENPLISHEEAANLRELIENYELHQKLKEEKQAYEDDNNDWWIDQDSDQDSEEEEKEDDKDSNKKEDEEYEAFSIEDYLERKYEDDFESWKQNMIDDHFDA